MEKFQLGFSLFILGFIGILTLLLVPLPIEKVPEELLQKFSERELRFLTLANPFVFLAIAVTLGSILNDRVLLQAPILKSILFKEIRRIKISGKLLKGTIGGVVVAIALFTTQGLFQLALPNLFEKFNDIKPPHLLTRVFYGGITEEILLRFGVMTFIVWLLFKITKILNNSVYWIGILVSSIIFAIGHLPVAFQVVNQPPALFLIYILLANTLGGMVYGFLYWKEGLESAITAHIVTHLVLFCLSLLIASFH